MHNIKMNKIEELIKLWKEKYCNENERYSESQIYNIAANCLSLSKTWFDNNKSREKESYELDLYNKDGVLCEKLHGITSENLPLTMMSIITNECNSYSSMSLVSYRITKDTKDLVSNELGKMDIS